MLVGRVIGLGGDDVELVRAARTGLNVALIAGRQREASCSTTSVGTACCSPVCPSRRRVSPNLAAASPDVVTPASTLS